MGFGNSNINYSAIAFKSEKLLHIYRYSGSHYDPNTNINQQKPLILALILCRDYIQNIDRFAQCEI